MEKCYIVGICYVMSEFTDRSRDLHFRLLSFCKYSIWPLVQLSAERGVGAGIVVYLFFKECCFRVRVRVRLGLG